LTRVFTPENAKREWTTRAIHDEVGAERHAGLGVHLDKLVELGLMESLPATARGAGRRYRVIPPAGLDDAHREVRAGLVRLLRALDELDRSV
jgi:hypothetical protein